MLYGHIVFDVKVLNEQTFIKFLVEDIGIKKKFSNNYLNPSEKYLKISVFYLFHLQIP